LVPTSMGKNTRLLIGAVVISAIIFIVVTTILTFTAGGDNAGWVVVGISLVGFTVMLGFLMKWTRDGTAEPDHIKYTTLGMTLTLIILCSSFLAIIYAAPPTSSYSIGGAVRDVSGTGMTLTNGKDTLTIASGSIRAFTFKNKVAKGSRYDVKIKQQPSSSTCVLSGGIGTATKDINTITITCTVSWKIGGTLSNIKGSGMVLTNNKKEELLVPAAATKFQFLQGVPDQSAYLVEVKTPPSGQTCVVDHGSADHATADVNDIVITCAGGDD